MPHVHAQVARYVVRSFDLANADPALDAVPSRDEIAGCVEELPKYKAGTKESIVNEMLKYGGLAILDMLAGFVETLWTTRGYRDTGVPGSYWARELCVLLRACVPVVLIRAERVGERNACTVLHACVCTIPTLETRSRQSCNGCA